MRAAWRVGLAIVFKLILLTAPSHRMYCAHDAELANRWHKFGSLSDVHCSPQRMARKGERHNFVSQIRHEIVARDR